MISIKLLLHNLHKGNYIDYFIQLSISWKDSIINLPYENLSFIWNIKVPKTFPPSFLIHGTTTCTHMIAILQSQLFLIQPVGTSNRKTLFSDQSYINLASWLLLTKRIFKMTSTSVSKNLFLIKPSSHKFSNKSVLRKQTRKMTSDGVE